MNHMNYWVVGATWGKDDVTDDFYLRGYWEMGFQDSDKPKFTNRRDSVKKGDRIAVKKRNGRAAKTISIRGIGIVKDVADGKVYIDWLLKNIEGRNVPCVNYFGTIHGPITDKSWRNEAFCL